MRDYYNETVDATTFQEIRGRRRWDYTMPVRRRYVRFLPPQSFLIGDDACLVLSGPKTVRFRRRWSLETIEREIRVTYVINDGGHKPYFKIHLV